MGCMKKSHLTLATLLLVWSAAAVLAASAAVPKKTEAAKAQKHAKEASDFFAGVIPRLKIELSPEQRERLAKDERNYVECMLTETTPAGPRLYEKVSVKLKGSAGSFQHMDGKPGLTLNMEKIKGGDRFHGMKKFHLNNCAQDGTYLSELISGEMARLAGVPASRCSHAFVEFNGRDLGLYVVKEAFTKDFLAYFYKNTDGDIYDGGFCAEVNENTEKDQGDPKDKAALKELIAACQEGDAAKRWERLGKILDIENFIDLLRHGGHLLPLGWLQFQSQQLPLLLGPGIGEVFLFPARDGSDFRRREFPGDPGFRRDGRRRGDALSARGPVLYRARVASLHESVLLQEDWPARVTAVGKRVQAAIAAKDARWAKEYEGQIAAAQGKVARRIAAVGRQLGAVPKPVAFDANGVAKLTKGWSQDGTGAVLDEVAKDAQPCLHIRAEGATLASWRQTLRLEAGRYRFEAKVSTANVVGVKDTSGEGAGLRISGGVREGQNAAVGSAAWQPIGYTFETPGGDIVLVAELRASKGEVWFARESMRLVKAK